MKLLQKLYPDWLKPKENDKLSKVKFVIKYKSLNIAELTTDEENNYVFKYTDDFKEQYNKEEKYVRKIAGFKNVDKIYKSKYLYPFFLSRIPDPKRPIIHEIVQKEKIDPNNPLALLERFARKTLDNPFIVERQ